MFRGAWQCAVLVLLSIAARANAEVRPAVAPKTSEEEIARLVTQLGDEHYFVREQAQQKLRRFDVAAFDALSAAERNADPEIAARAGYLLRSIRIQWVEDHDPPEIQRVMAEYERERPDKRRQLILTELAVLSADTGTEPLCRIVRFERHPVLAKLAAVAVFDRPPPTGESLARQLQSIDRALGPSQRTPALWLRAHRQFTADPDAALAMWEKLAAEETAAWEANPQESDRDVIVGLRRRQYTMLAERGRKIEAAEILRRLVQLQPSQTASLSRFVDWLVLRKEWAAIDEVAQRFSRQFERDAVLLYKLAQARTVQGQPELAEQLAKQALGLSTDGIRGHLLIGRHLQELGMFAWAEREYRHVIEQAPAETTWGIDACQLLGQMLEDNERYRESADVRRKLVEMLDKASPRRNAGRLPSYYTNRSTILGQIELCEANHARQQGNVAKQIEHLDKAVRHDPLNGDTLIALYRLPNQDDARRARTRGYIERAAAVFESRITSAEEDADDEMASNCNQYAWLVANTLGDFDKALKYAQRAVDIRPTSAALLDTLSHCHYAKGDLDSALRVQLRAVQLEPHSGPIQRQLRAFQAEAAARTKSQPPEPR